MSSVTAPPMKGGRPNNKFEGFKEGVEQQHQHYDDDKGGYKN
jgi:hypothetical protein